MEMTAILVILGGFLVILRACAHLEQRKTTRDELMKIYNLGVEHGLAKAARNEPPSYTELTP